MNGTAWKLAVHLGKEASHDPHHTIRIAFAWDEQNERVIGRIRRPASEEPEFVDGGARMSADDGPSRGSRQPIVADLLGGSEP